MPIRVLVVDDSSFFRRIISQMLEADPQLQVIGTATNGQEAIEQALSLKPDVIIMDIEMPVLDGISAVRRIMAQAPTAILMFSSLTQAGAQATLDALEAGAVDFLPKRFQELAADRREATELLQQRVKTLGAKSLAPSRHTGASTASVPAPAAASRSFFGGFSAKAPVVSPRRSPYKVLAIGTSTGGPVALQKVLVELPKDFPVPLLLVQHMPASFTPAFAKRLDGLCQIQVKEAEDGELLHPGVAYLAPGGQQMLLHGNPRSARLQVMAGDPAQNYKPCVDLTFGALAQVFQGDVLAVIMTGMGADGREGARKLKSCGATIWSQDEASSVVYGMPMAVARAGLSDRVLALNDIGPRLVQEF